MFVCMLCAVLLVFIPARTHGTEGDKTLFVICGGQSRSRTGAPLRSLIGETPLRRRVSWRVDTRNISPGIAMANSPVTHARYTSATSTTIGGNGRHCVATWVLALALAGHLRESSRPYPTPAPAQPRSPRPLPPCVSGGARLRSTLCPTARPVHTPLRGPFSGRPP